MPSLVKRMIGVKGIPIVLQIFATITQATLVHVKAENLKDTAVIAIQYAKVVGVILLGAIVVRQLVVILRELFVPAMLTVGVRLVKNHFLAEILVYKTGPVDLTYLKNKCILYI